MRPIHVSIRTVDNSIFVALDQWHWGCQAMSEGLVTRACQRANGPTFTILGNNHTVRLSSCLSCRHGIHCYGLMDLMGGALRSGVRIRCHFPNQTACTMLFFLQCLQVTPAYVLRSSRFFLPRCLVVLESML